MLEITAKIGGLRGTRLALIPSEMGLWTQIYTSSQRFNRQLRGGAVRPGTRRASQLAAGERIEAPPRYVCPKCTDPVPPNVECDRCGVESIDRETKRRAHRLGAFPRRTLRELARKVTRAFDAMPVVPIASAEGRVRVRGTIVSVAQSVDGRVAWMRKLRRELISDVGMFVIRDESGTLSVGTHVQDIRVLPTKEGWDLEVGDEVELIGTVTPAGEGAYRTGHATLSAELWEPALLRPTKA